MKTKPQDQLIPLSNFASDLLSDCLADYGLTQTALSACTGISVQTICDILKGRRLITVNQALRFGHYFGNGADLWLRLQNDYLLMKESREHANEIEQLPSLRSA